jgi:PmbA protein
VLRNALGQARRLGAAAAKIRFRQREQLGCSFENGRLKSAETAQSASYTVTVLADGRKGSATGTRAADLSEMVSRAVTLAKVGSVAHHEAWPEPGEVTGVAQWSAETASLPRERLIEGCEQMVETLKAYDDELFIEAHGRRTEREELLVTTGGVCHPTTSSSWHLGSYAQRTAGTDMLFAGFDRDWRALDERYDPAYIAGQVVEDLRRGRQAAPAPPHRCTALLSPEMLALLLWAVEMGVNGRNVAKGDSPLRGRIAQRVLNERFTVVDDPHVPYAPGSAEIDADGVPTRKMRIFDAGVLEGFLYDLDSAHLAGAQPTGHDHCEPHNLEVLPGSRSHEQILADIDDGIFIKQLMGFGQGNLVNGDFSCNVALGFRVRDGQVVGRVKNAMAAGNVYELLAGGVELSRDRDAVRRLPYAAIEGLSVSAAEG